MTRWTFTVDQEVRETIRYDVTIEAETEVEARGQIELGDWDDTKSRVVRSSVLDQTETLVAIDGELADGRELNSVVESRLLEIAERKAQGTDCTADESALIKYWLREWGDAGHTSQILIQHFPLEWDESAPDPKDVYDPHGGEKHRYYEGN